MTRFSVPRSRPAGTPDRPYHPSRPGCTAEVGASPGTMQQQPDATCTGPDVTRRKPMNDFQAIADRVEIEALRGDFTDPAPAERLERAATALTAHGFTVEVLDDAVTARTRIKDLIPESTSVFTGASQTLRRSATDEAISTSGRSQAVRPRVLAMDRAPRADDIRRLIASPDVVVGSVAALTETGSLVVASASGSQLPAYAGGAARAIWIVGAQKVVPDLSTALRRVEEHALPLESARAQLAYGQPSAINRLLILNAEPYPGRATVLLLREAIGF